MGIEAFVIRDDSEGRLFTESFVGSPEFDRATLERIIRNARLIKSSDRIFLIDQIGEACQQSTDVRQIVIKELVIKDKGWMAVRKGKRLEIPKLADPNELVTSRGAEKWYGPIRHPDDNAYWYIRPTFKTHWELPEGKSEPEKGLIRWLCFARISPPSYVSLHWHGFTYLDEKRNVLSGRHNSQFEYWQYIPKFYEEMESLMNTTLEDVDLHNLVLHKLWNQYRNTDHEWIDRRLRAESNGVALSAHAGRVYELDVGGITSLADSIRQAIEDELESVYDMTLPDPKRFNEVILQKLIRNYGARSYEFSLQKNDKRIFRAHCYFGMRPDSPSPDSLQHLNVFRSWGDDIGQLIFLVSHL